MSLHMNTAICTDYGKPGHKPSLYYNDKKDNMEVIEMKKYLCEPCGYVYDPEVGDPDGGIAPGTAFEDIPDDWVCPICGLGKDVFIVEE